LDILALTLSITSSAFHSTTSVVTGSIGGLSGPATPYASSSNRRKVPTDDLCSRILKRCFQNPDTSRVLPASDQILKAKINQGLCHVYRQVQATQDLYPILE
jgi:hypothetical protein